MGSFWRRPKWYASIDGIPSPGYYLSFVAAIVLLVLNEMHGDRLGSVLWASLQSLDFFRFWRERDIARRGCVGHILFQSHRLGLATRGITWGVGSLVFGGKPFASVYFAAALGVSCLYCINERLVNKIVFFIPLLVVASLASVVTSKMHESVCIGIIAGCSLSAVFFCGKAYAEIRALNMVKDLPAYRHFSGTDFFDAASAALAHDLRQPIAAARFILNDTKSCVHDEKIISALHRLDCTIESISTTVEHSFLCAQSNTSAVEQRYQVVNIADVLERVFSEMEVIAAQRHVDFRVRYSDHCIMSDPAMLYRIIQNLVSNALKCVSTGGVLLSVRGRRDGRILLQVFDTGPGMPKYQIDRLAMVHPKRRVKRTGGLGLDIVRNFSAALNIQIAVRISENRGSTVSLYIPSIPERVNRAGI